jgi:hypothetical protein
MPTMWSHSAYWANATPEPPPDPPGPTSGLAYVNYQAVIVAGSGFGALQAAYDWVVARTGTAWPRGRTN